MLKKIESNFQKKKPLYQKSGCPYPLKESKIIKKVKTSNK